MYKLIIALLLCLLFSCQQDEMVSATCSAPVHINEITDYDFFIHDNKHNLIYDWVMQLAEMESHRPAFMSKYQEIKTLCCSLTEEFGFENSLGYLDRVIAENSASTTNGACCSFFDDGQNAWFCCGMWKSIKVVFLSTTCVSNQSNDLEEINEWLGRVRDYVCVVC